MFLDIVILPPPALRKKLGRTVKQATKEIPTVFIVDDKKLILHLSLFHIKTSIQRFNVLSSKLSPILKKYDAVKIRSLEYYSAGRAICLELSSSRTLKNLHTEIVENCYKLRIGVMPSHSKHQGLERKYRREYGVQHIFKKFRPHFTLMALKDADKTVQVIKKLPKLRFQFSTNTVAICQVNKWYQVTKILKTFKLRAP